MEIKFLNRFLTESNAIEREYSREAFEDSLEAWNYAVGNYDNFGVDYVCGIHERLMRRLNPDIAGKLRRKKAYIVASNLDGERFILEEFEAKGNRGRLRKWCDKYGDAWDLEKMKEAHIEFEGIHPFPEGNGRVGRILYNTQRVNSGFDIMVFFEAAKDEYYRWFEKGRRDKDMIRLLRKN